MLSAVIPSRHSYPAMLLAEQLVDQRSVHPGPLVVYSPVSGSTDYIFIRSILRIPLRLYWIERGWRHLTHACCRSLWNDSSSHESECLSTQVVTGSNQV